MNRISQEGADYIKGLIEGVVDSIDKKIGVGEAPVAESVGKKSKKKAAKSEPAINKIADELNALIELGKQVDIEWEKV
tara:strand:+ start:1867 stop:2100 length:234 start_codon:yes stop_codon:yes gene_type:complete